MLFIARETSSDERSTERHSQLHGIDRRLLIDFAFLRFRADVGRGRELAFREPVDAVVLDDVAHIEIAAHSVCELTDTDRQRIAVTRNAQQMQIAVRSRGARRDRRHASVHRIEPVRGAQEICRCL